MTIWFKGIRLHASKRQCNSIPFYSLAGRVLVGFCLGVLGGLVMSSLFGRFELLLPVRLVDAGLPTDTFLGLCPRPGR